jgi:hypothetical protein
VVFETASTWNYYTPVGFYAIAMARISQSD